MTGQPADDELEAMRFEELVSTLEDLTRKISDAEVGIEEAAELYERAKVVHRMASERLDAIRRRIDEIDAGDDHREPERRVSGGA